MDDGEEGARACIPLRKAWVHEFQRDYYEYTANEPETPSSTLASSSAAEDKPAGALGQVPDWAVPSWITSNAWVARKVATLILHAWSDCLHSGSLSLSSPLVVLELGAGAGTLGVLLHAELRERMGRVLGAQARLLYIVSDFTERMHARWHCQPALSHAVQEGTMQFATVDVLAWQKGGQPSMVLQPSGKSMGPGDFINPVLCLAHYLFDSLPLDAWRVGPGHTLHEVTLAGDREGGEQGRLMHETQWTTGRTLIAPDDGSPVQYYSPPEYRPELSEQANRVLAWYAAHALHMRLDTEHVRREWEEPGWSPDSTSEEPSSLPDSASFTLPLGALACLDMLGRLCSPGGALLSCMDKGWGAPGAFVGQGPPDLHSHGSFSYMVNFHALHLASRPPPPPSSTPSSTPSSWAPVTWFHAHDDDVHVRWELALIGQALQGAPLPCMRDSWAYDCRSFGPSEVWDLYDLGQRGALAGQGAEGGRTGDEGGSEEQEGGMLTSRAAIALCRLSNWDTDVYSSMKPVLTASLPSLTPPRLHTLLQGLHTMQQRVQPGERGTGAGAHALDVSFEIGRAYQLGGHPRLAILHYLSSLSSHGSNSYPTLLNLGTCCMALGQARHALAWFTKAVEAGRQVEHEVRSAQQWVSIATQKLAEEEEVQGGGRSQRAGTGMRLPSGRTVLDASQL